MYPKHHFHVGWNTTAQIFPKFMASYATWRITGCLGYLKTLVLRRPPTMLEELKNNFTSITRNYKFEWVANSCELFRFLLKIMTSEPVK